MRMLHLRKSINLKRNLPKANKSNVSFETKKTELSYKKFHTSLTLFRPGALMLRQQFAPLPQDLLEQFLKKTFLTSPSEQKFSKAAQPENFQLIGPELPVLEIIYNTVKNQANGPNFKKTIFVCGQHLLNTTVSLFELFIRLGADPKNIFVVGKTYSNNEKVIGQIQSLGIQYQPYSKQRTLGGFITAYEFDIGKMWEKTLKRIQEKADMKENIDGIIVLDDGGHVLSQVPEEIEHFIIGIEQTSSGIKSSLRTFFSTINLAGSAIKQWIEPSMVAEKVAEKLAKKLGELKKESLNFFPGQDPSCGIIGLGNIGQEVLLVLIKKGYKRFIICDKDQNKSEQLAEKIRKECANLGVHIESVDSPVYVFPNTNIIIGCTGKDVTEFNLVGFKAIQTPKILISSSSKDIEFHTLLGYIQEKRRSKKISALEDIEFQNGFGAPLKIVRGGMPINFDNSEESVPAADIQVIRGLKAVAVLQAYSILQDWHIKGEMPNSVQSYKLDPQLQAFVASAWLQTQPTQRYPAEIRRKYTDPIAIFKHSSGVIYDSSQLVESETQERPYQRWCKLG